MFCLQEVGLLVLVSSLLLTLSESDHFMAMLVDTPAGGVSYRTLRRLILGRSDPFLIHIIRPAFHVPYSMHPCSFVRRAVAS